MADKDICLSEIGIRIVERRKQLGYTQEELAESGKRAMRPENLLKLAKALNVSADYLLTGDIVEKDMLILSDKMKNLTPSQVRIIENIIDECNSLFE